jgi:transcriptional regulator of acetoin/glycerol metabolism
MAMSTERIACIRHAWENFLASGHDPLAVRPSIAASWRRSKLSGVAPDDTTFPFRPGGTTSRLVSAAEPVLNRFAMSLPGTDVCIVLADRGARIVGRWVGDAGLERRLTASSIDRGFVVDEEVAGTNGIGTVIEEMRPIEVVGPEHYVAALQTLTCVGVPIRHPLSGRLEGVLDLACPTADANSLLLPTVIDLGAQIERELFDRVSDSERSVLRAFVARNRETTRPLIALTDQFMMANASASPWLDGVDQAFLLEQGDMTSLSAGEVVREMTFSGGRTSVARCRPVRAGLKIAGLLIEIESTATPRRRSRPTGAHRSTSWTNLTAAGMAGTSDSWRRIADRCAQLVPTLPVRIEGEAGTGKMTLARHLHQSLRPSSTCTALPATLEGVLGSAEWLRRAFAGLQPVTAGSEAVGTLILAHVDWLSEPAAIALGDMIDHIRDTAPLVISTVIPGDRPLCGPLEDRLRTQVVTVPPLRGRPEDIAGIADELIRRHASGPAAPRLMPSALRLLMRREWPGNVRELEALVIRLLATGRGHDIRPVDLAELGSGTPLGRVLGNLEALERDAIVRALRDADGNKTAAALALGMSRSTLYRKLTHYRVDPDRVVLG